MTSIGMKFVRQLVLFMLIISVVNSVKTDTDRRRDCTRRGLPCGAPGFDLLQLVAMICFASAANFVQRFIN
uniref:Uncharacterized protein n=1 Tax=Panagrellus redivivus TaxID=6233 RepID=A0A7E4VWW7_PANRE